MFLCPKCYKETDEGYCPQCGCHVNTLYARLALLIRQKIRERRKKQRIICTVAALACVVVIVALLAVLLGNRNEVVLTVPEAQAQMDAALEDVYGEASPDNYIVQFLKGKVKITVGSVKSAENECLAECTVTSVDIATPVLNYLLALEEGTIDTYSNVVADLQKAITEADEIQQTFRVKFIPVNGEYKAMLPEEMVVFCSGNIQEVLPKLYEILQGGALE